MKKTLMILLAILCSFVYAEEKFEILKSYDKEFSINESDFIYCSLLFRKDICYEKVSGDIGLIVCKDGIQAGSYKLTDEDLEEFISILDKVNSIAFSESFIGSGYYITAVTQSGKMEVNVYDYGYDLLKVRILSHQIDICMNINSFKEFYKAFKELYLHYTESKKKFLANLPE